ncbi:hypothetical protein N601_10365 [Rhodococcus erythropolis DN1]|nr:hypothetical protein N601_10365 [Rhodococcus erythropolis DN1]
MSVHLCRAPLRADTRTDPQSPAFDPFNAIGNPDARSDSTLVVDTGFRHTPPAQAPPHQMPNIDLF